VHNLRPHERPRRSTAAIAALCDRWTTAWIRLNPHTPLPAGALSATILLGHYREWFDRLPSSDPLPGRLLCFGLIRPYKGVEGLLEVVKGMPDADVSLRVTGMPSTPQVADTVRAAAGHDHRISLVLEHVPDDVLVSDAGQAELVVLPYRELHNSSAVLLALSLGRPVLVPRNEVTDSLADEVGPWWVQRFEGDLDAAAIRDALAAVSEPAPGPPDLAARDWSLLGRQHAELFRAARATARRVHPAASGSEA
jgi:beta-1,4-mannosyltransferase